MSDWEVAIVARVRNEVVRRVGENMLGKVIVDNCAASRRERAEV